MHRRCTSWGYAGIIVLVNVLVGAVFYLLFGWHFIRGYNEVGNFIVEGLIHIGAGLNAVIAILAGGWLGLTKPWKSARRARGLTVGFAASALLLFASPQFVPTIGRFANHQGILHTPLVEAARYGDDRLVAILVRNGANPNVKHDVLGTTPLHYVARSGSHSVVQILLENGADPNARAEHSLETPLHWAVEARANLKTIELLAEYGADPNLKERDGETPLDYAQAIPDPKGSAIYQVFGRGGIPRG